MTPPADADGDTAPRFLLDSPLGQLAAVFTDGGLRRLDYADAARPLSDAEPNELVTLRQELHRYFAGEPVEFATPLDTVGTAFQQSVWAALREIPFGETRSYADVAQAIGRPTACRAVAAANARNPISILVPCHRVIGSDGGLTGYAGGLDRKRRLLDLERGVRRLIA